MTAPDPDRLTDLGKRVEEAQKRQAAAAKRPPPSQAGIAGRFATELVAALVVGGGLGWGIDWLFGGSGRDVLDGGTGDNHLESGDQADEPDDGCGGH